MWVFMCGSVPFFFSPPPPAGCSCDDVGAAAPRPLVDPRDLEGDGDERTQHHLEKSAVCVGDHNSAVKHIGSWRCSMKMALITFVWSWIEIRGKS